MPRLITLVFLLLWFCLYPLTESGFCQEKETITVTSDGYSYLGDNDTIKTARERALTEAERSAIEQGSYSYLESQTTVKDFQVTSDEIVSKAKGVIIRKKILVDEMESDTLRYHIRLEAEVKVTDIETSPQQSEVASPSPTAEQPPPPQTSDTSDIPTSRKPSAEAQLHDLSRLKRLKKKRPHRYIQLMTRVQPQLDSPGAFRERVRQLHAKHPKAGQRVRELLRSAPVRGGGSDKLKKRLLYLKAKRPESYILMMEILFPEVRPRAMSQHFGRIKGAQRDGGATPATPNPSAQ
jgi:hypothetical protein